MWFAECAAEHREKVGNKEERRKIVESLERFSGQAGDKMVASGTKDTGA